MFTPPLPAAAAQEPGVSSDTDQMKNTIRNFPNAQGKLKGIRKPRKSDEYLREVLADKLDWFA
jgi:hypothetical protein